MFETILSISKDIDMNYYTTSCDVLTKTLLLAKEDNLVETYKIDGTSFSFGFQRLFNEPTNNQLLVLNVDEGEEIILPDKYEKDTIVSLYLTKTFERRLHKRKIDSIDVFKNTTDNETVIINRVCRIIMTNDFMEEVSYILPSIIPWHFKQKDKKTVEFFKKISESNINTIFEEKMKNSTTYKNALMKKLRDLSDDIKNRSLKTADYDLREKEEKLANLINRVRRITNEITELKHQKFIISMQGEERSNFCNEILDFLTNTRENISIKKIIGSSICLEIHTTLDQFDEEDSEALINNHNSYIYDYLDSYGHYEYEVYEEFLREFLINQNIVYHSSTEIIVDVVEENVRCSDLDVLNNNEGRHPHLNDDISCFGNATSVILDYLQNKKYTEMLNQIVYISKQLTVSDSYAVNILLREAAYQDNLEIDGEFFNLNDILANINEKMEEENND